MINTEYLAICAIFITGFYMGFKIKTLISDIRENLEDKKNLE